MSSKSASEDDIRDPWSWMVLRLLSDPELTLSRSEVARSKSLDQIEQTKSHHNKNKNLFQEAIKKQISIFKQTRYIDVELIAHQLFHGWKYFLEIPDHFLYDEHSFSLWKTNRNISFHANSNSLTKIFCYKIVMSYVILKISQKYPISLEDWPLDLVFDVLMWIG